MKAVADTLSAARSHPQDRVRRPPISRAYIKASDEALLPLIRRLIHQCPTYGYRRITALVTRALAAESRPADNHKRSSGS
jgi:putative transposase